MIVEPVAHSPIAPSIQAASVDGYTALERARPRMAELELPRMALFASPEQYTHSLKMPDNAMNLLGLNSSSPMSEIVTR